MPVKTILIVEDNLVNQRLLMVVLQPHGYRLITAQDGEEAVRLAQQEHPDLVLMDLQLPKMSGIAATHILKNQIETAQIPVVALTAHSMDEVWPQAKREGFCGYITKPIDTRTFPTQVLLFLNSDE